MPQLRRLAARTQSMYHIPIVTHSPAYKPPLLRYDNVPRKPAKMPDIHSTPPQAKKCLVLDLDETLVHSSFQPVAQAHYTIPVTIEGVVHNVFVIKRPGVDEFLRVVGEHYEVLIYTASLSKYADPLLDELDVSKVRSCTYYSICVICK